MKFDPRSLAAAALIAGLSVLTPALYAADEQPAEAETISEETEVQAEEAKGLFNWKLAETAVGDSFGKHGISFYGHLQQGYTINPDSPKDRQNFGRLFDDRSNDYRLNQLLLTLDKPLNAEKLDEFDIGFRAQLMYGSDGRFTHYLGIADEMDNNSVQFDVMELYANLHFPVLTEGGVDLKAGHFVTLMGAEVIDAKGNPLYSHSYSFNFGIPFKHTGFLATVHATDWLDLIGGVVGGINTGYDDNNDEVSFHGGILTKFADGKVTTLTSFYSGADNDEAFGDDASEDARSIFSSVTTIQWSDRFRTMTDLNYGQDDGGLGLASGKGDTNDAEWYGVAQYFIYDLDPKLAVVFRGEVFRDDDGFAVVQFAENDDLIDLERGQTITDPRTVGGGATTYYAMTLGLNIKPVDSILIRPEVRYDWSDNADGASDVYDDSSDSDQFTIGFDVVWSF